MILEYWVVLETIASYLGHLYSVDEIVEQKDSD